MFSRVNQIIHTKDTVEHQVEHTIPVRSTTPKRVHLAGLAGVFQDLSHEAHSSFRARAFSDFPAHKLEPIHESRDSLETKSDSHKSLGFLKPTVGTAPHLVVLMKMQQE